MHQVAITHLREYVSEIVPRASLIYLHRVEISLHSSRHRFRATRHRCHDAFSKNMIDYGISTRIIECKLTCCSCLVCVSFSSFAAFFVFAPFFVGMARGNE